MKVEILKQKGYNFLYLDDYLWMWDTPVEREIQKKIAVEAFGDVLVAGYGLGLIQRYLVENPNVQSVLTIEKHPEVISACNAEYGCIHGRFDLHDFHEFPHTNKFDCVIGDIWAEIVPEGLQDYKRFKFKAEKHLKPNGIILAWGRDYFEYLIETGDSK